MHQGVQLYAPDGHDRMAKDVVFYFIRSDQKLRRVLLICLSEETLLDGCRRQRDDWSKTARLCIMSSNKFEEGLMNGRIREVQSQRTLPPWLERTEGVDIEAIDVLRTGHPRLSKRRTSNNDTIEFKEVQSHAARIDRIEEVLSDALLDTEGILSAPDPRVEINRYARAATPKQNESRFRVQFWVKMCFPKTRWALLPPYCRIGHWNRGSKKHKNKRFGRPGKRLGAHYGNPCNAPEIVERMVAGYTKYSDIGNLPAIYERVMIKEFGCVSARLPGEKFILDHPLGHPFPSLNQFRYRVDQAIGRARIRRNLWGEARVRSRLEPSHGRYSEALANLMEKVGTDVQYREEIPVALDGITELPRLCVARIVCETSGMVVGVGFTLRPESNRAYRAAMFCAAIGKSEFGRLFGIPIEPDEWPSQGLPIAYHSDRGPGSKTWANRDSESEPAIRSLSPSYTPQSNATVEASHERSPRRQGAPTRKVSGQTPVQMARAVIVKTLAHNHSADASNRMTPEMFATGVHATPIGVWNYLDKRCRTVAQMIDFDQAVRTYLEEVEFTCVDGAIELHGQLFRSDALYEWIQTANVKTVKGFVLELAVRYAWVDVGGSLIEVEALLPLRDDEGQLYLSLSDLEVLGDWRRAAKNDQRWSAPAARAYFRQKCLGEVGGMWDDGRRVPGRAKPRSKAAQKAAKAFQLP